MTTNAMLSAYNDTDQIYSTAIFGEVKISVISKDFKGGKITNFFAVTEVDFSNADLNGIAVINFTQLFAEIKIRVPADWRVETDLAQVFAEVEDKRKDKWQINSGKVLLLKGFSSFASVTIKSVKQ